ncbi:MAG: type II secretion system F family protein [Bryobacter sp.]
MLAPLLIFGFFVVTFGLVIGGLVLVRSRMAATETAAASSEPLLLRDESLSSIGFWGELLERFRFVEQAKRHMQQADLDWSAGRYTALMLMSGASTAVVLSRFSWVPTVGIVLGGIVALSAPAFYVSHKRQKRFEQFDQNFPDALDSLGRALRAGHAFAAGLNMVATESLPPVAGEMRKTLEEWRLGQSWDEALEHLAERVPLPSVRLFVASVRMQTRTGGKLHEVLGRIAETLREASSLEGEIRAISAHGRMTGTILTLIPVGIAVVMHFASPGHLEILSEHPVGRLMVAAILCLVAAHFVIRKILDIKM